MVTYNENCSSLLLLLYLIFRRSTRSSVNEEHLTAMSVCLLRFS
jgi:hypothetical protein